MQISLYYTYPDVNTRGTSPDPPKPRWYVYISTSTLVLTSLVPLGPFDGRVAAVVEDFVCTTPNQTRIFLPSMRKAEVRLRADARYGPDDPTLWPQPWVERYCHLGAIPRKPDDPNDPLSIMWWDPTCDDFKSLDGSLVDGIGELCRGRSCYLCGKCCPVWRVGSRITDGLSQFPTNIS